MTAYRDRDGDVWSQQEDGNYRTPGEYARPLESVASSYGPLTPLRPEADAVAEAVPMSREEALAKATEHVNTLATNGRGYQDGVSFAAKVEAVERLARFLVGETMEEAG